jgi:asparagine synthase (glutamine-hydrolysing)
MTEDFFAFGSEIRQLLPLLPSVRANTAAVIDFIFTGVQVQSTETFFNCVTALLPGNSLLYNITTEKYVITRYYNLSDCLGRVVEIEDRDAINAFRDTFEDAIRLRLRSDVTVGTCLSGGLDSSSIALTAGGMHRAASNDPFRAVTAVSEDPINSEEVHAGKVVRAGSLRWIRTRPTYDDFRATLPQVVRQQEEPFASPSICMQSFVMKAAHENGIIVLLDGQGGDETMLGYDRYYPGIFLMLVREVGIRAALQWVRNVVHCNSDASVRLFAAHCLWGLVPSARTFYYKRQSRFLVQSAGTPKWMKQLAAAYRDIRHLQVLEIELKSLPPLLRYEDKNSMAYSIETRLPFLDYRLVEQAILLPHRLKMRDGWTKWILREAMRDVLPASIAWRRDKIAFAAPTQMWLKRHLPAMVELVEQSPLIGRHCDRERLRTDYGRLHWQSQWRLYSLAMWEREFNVSA